MSSCPCDAQDTGEGVLSDATRALADTVTSPTEAPRCPMRPPAEDAPPSGEDAAASRPQRDLKKLVHVDHDIRVLYAQPTQAHHEPYYDIKPAHLKQMNAVLRALTEEAGGSTVEHGLVKAKQLLKSGVNPDMLRHALGIYLTHSRDAQKRRIVVPPLKDHATMRQIAAAASANTLSVVGGQVVTPDTQTGPAVLAYWREDYDYNDHHIHWHTVFPGTGVFIDGKNVPVIDRQGELFLYMHSQMVARYETEGICWNLPLVRPWNQYDDVLEYGYVPMPGFITSYGGYPPFSSWYAVRNPNIPPGAADGPVPRATLEIWRDNIYQAIRDGYFWTKNEAGDRKPYNLTPENCANLVGVVIEAESAPLLKLETGYTLDDEIYGNLHNFGHDKFAEMSFHDFPAAQSQYGLMISNFGSPRDSAFWPWHKHVQYFGRLAAAKFPQDLTAHKAAVELTELDIRMQAETRRGGLNTFLGPPATNLMESLAKLDHAPYLWSVNVVSALSPRPTPKKPQVVTLRFFIAAKQLMEDYHNWIEMDKVSVTLTSGEVKFNIRFDKESSVSRKMGNYSELDPDFASAWCRCGWPQNMMLPVGKPEGMEFVGFCIATNDVVSEDVKAPALSYCGALNSERKYPDPRGMGYPFNQVWTQHINPQKDGRNAKLSEIINDHAAYPFLTTTEFEIYRNTKPFYTSEIDPPPVPTSSPTWYDPIQSYFLPGDVTCMKYEYGYDLSDYDDVMLHSGAIYDACSNKRMPLQMTPFTQDNPDPKHPMWSDQMCETFKAWMFNGCPKGKDPNPPPPPPPPSKATWDDPIKGYFLPADVTCMQGNMNLGDHASVKANAKAIYQAVSSGSMPKQMDPFTQSNPDPKHPLWTKDMCDTFNGWMLNGCP